MVIERSKGGVFLTIHTIISLTHLDITISLTHLKNDVLDIWEDINRKVPGDEEALLSFGETLITVHRTTDKVHSMNQIFLDLGEVARPFEGSFRPEAKFVG